MDEFESFWIGLMIGILGCMIIRCATDDAPTALDVYQDKTTLEITYRDSIPVDSVVVFN